MFEPNEDKDRQDNPYNSYSSMDNGQSEQGAANYSNYYSAPGEQPPKKNGNGGGVFLKVIALVAVCAVVSFCSIEIYKGRTFIAQQTAESGESESEDEGDDESSTASNSDEGGDEDVATESSSSSSVSWITAASADDALSIPDIVEKVMPSVVGVSATFEYEVTTSSNFGNFFGYGGSGSDNTTTYEATGTGTGIIMSEDGYIITNAHCICDTEEDTNYGEAVAVSILLYDDTVYDATIIGYDTETDLAVLKIDATGLTAAEFGDSDELRVGELVVAIGNPLGFDLFGTTTCGIVSALNREITVNEKKMTLIQTDVAINSGNSGGPLINCYGQVIGINSLKMSSSSSSSASVEGLSFAIPITSAADIINDLINYGYVTGRPQFGFIGVDVSESDSMRYNLPTGVYVYSVTEGSAADLAGLQQGDVVTAIEGTEISSMDELNEIKNEYSAGDTVTLSVYRSGEELELSVTLQEAEASS